jgi:hypothetical protein
MSDRAVFAVCVTALLIAALAAWQGRYVHVDGMYFLDRWTWERFPADDFLDRTIYLPDVQRIRRKAGDLDLGRP